MKNIITNKYFLSLLMLLAWLIPIKTVFAATSSFFEASNVLQYVNVAYTWGSMMVGGLALVVITYAGINYMRAFGNSEVIQRSKVLISGALIGLFLVFGGYFILRIMDPRLVELKLTIPSIKTDTAVDYKYCGNIVNKTCDRTKDTNKVGCKWPLYVSCVYGGLDTDVNKTAQVFCDADNKWKLSGRTPPIVIQHRNKRSYIDSCGCDDTETQSGDTYTSRLFNDNYCIWGTVWSEETEIHSNCYERTKRCASEEELEDQ